MRIEKKAITDVELDYDYVMSDLEQRELIRWFFQNKPDMIREIICEECPEHIETANYCENKTERGK